MFRLVLFTLASLNCHAHPGGEPASSPVTLEEAKKFAVEHNPGVQSLRRELDEKVAVIGQARSGFYPTLGIGGGVQSAQGGKVVPLGYGYANYNLFRGMGDVYKIRLADLDSQIAETHLRQAELKVGLDVEQQFHLYLYKKTAIELKKQALALNDTHRKMAAVKRSAGMTSTSDLMEFDLRDALLRSDLLLLAQEKEETRIRLRRLLGEDVGSTIEPVGNLQHQHLKGDVDSYLKQIKDHSEAVRLASRELAKSNIEANLWRSRWLPALDFEMQIGYLDVNLRPPGGGFGGQGMLVAKFDLFSGFSTYYEQREGEQRRLKTEAKFKEVLLATTSDTDVAYRRLKTIQERVDIEEQNEERSAKYYQAILAEYRRGVKNSADVKVAAESLFDAKLRKESFKYEFLNQKIELERSVGAALETEVVKE